MDLYAEILKAIDNLNLLMNRSPELDKEQQRDIYKRMEDLENTASFYYNGEDH